MEKERDYPDFHYSLGHNLHRMGQLTREETQKVLKKFDLTPEQWQILLALSKSNGLTPSELGEITLRDKTTISRILPALFRKGMIHKQKRTGDARSYVIQLDEKCHMLLMQTVEEIRDHYQTVVFRSLSATEQDQLLSLLLKIRRDLHDI
ncbi:MarR family winged helix-turn-helix transcriptional regulator [Brevibacillus ginsengisoli]|uniref:MarR family winged helix-turn-helix transcriptional regulator n=1 Tax=Brevibacillus ginsengisoli TaxID=363854 RepID=UPI003CEA532D